MRKDQKFKKKRTIDINKQVGEDKMYEAKVKIEKICNFLIIEEIQIKTMKYCLVYSSIHQVMLKTITFIS